MEIIGLVAPLISYLFSTASRPAACDPRETAEWISWLGLQIAATYFSEFTQASAFGHIKLEIYRRTLTHKAALRTHLA